MQASVENDDWQDSRPETEIRVNKTCPYKASQSVSETLHRDSDAVLIHKIPAPALIEKDRRYLSYENVCSVGSIQCD